MNIEFSDHAELKIAQRKLKRAQIVETVLHPDFTRASYSSRQELYKKLGKNHLKVVVVEENSTIVVVTAHWIAKAPKKT